MNLKESIRKILREEVKYIKPDEKVNQTLLKMVNTVFSGIEMYRKKISESTHKFTFCKDGEQIVYIVLYFDVDEDVWDDVRPTNERSFTTGILMVPKSLINRIGKANEVFFIDVGANVGLVSIAIASEGYKTLAIEPLPINIKKLRNNLKLNPNLAIEIIESAVGSHNLVSDSQFIEIFTPPGNSGASSFSKTWNPSFQPSQATLVKIDSLDNLCLHILDSSTFTHLLIKIDVEGMEFDVIAGASKILLKYRPHILIEWKPGQNALMKFQELEKVLKAYEYRMSPHISLNGSIPDCSFDPYLVYENLLLTPNKLS